MLMDEISITQFNRKMEGSLGSKEVSQITMGDDGISWKLDAFFLLYQKASITVDKAKWNSCTTHEKLDYLRGGFLTTVIVASAKTYKLYFCHPALPLLKEQHSQATAITYEKLQALPKV